MTLIPHSKSLPICALVAASLVTACSQPKDAERISERVARVNSDLAAFRADTRSFMNRIPLKRDRNGQPVSQKKFSDELIASGEFVVQRDEARLDTCAEQEDGTSICLSDALPGRAPIGYGDRAQDVVDNGENMVTSLREMESRKLLKAELAESPWSDDYWPIYSGQLGKRYADHEFPDSSQDWKIANDYVVSNHALDILRSENSTSIDALSPAEKYDLLVGDNDMSFTKANWQVGKGYYQSHGKVETWMGLCHGWAPAAYMLPRPTKSINVKAANGINTIRFYPSDLKALGTSLWANVRTSSRFVGGRCNTKDPKQDENGRVIDQDCFDTNPATWHLAVVNQIGVSKRSMVLDATFDYEVWNQPVHGYEYSYFNPKSDQYVDTIEEATVDLDAYSEDPFKKYRSAKARQVVGIAMEVSYVVETAPNHRRTDSAKYDAIHTATYYYDLELDGNHRIVGGEWYGNVHPDFLWTPAADSRARAYADRFAYGDWNAQSPMNEQWQRAAQSAAGRGQPLGKIVETLINASRAGLE